MDHETISQVVVALFLLAYLVLLPCAGSVSGEDPGLNSSSGAEGSALLENAVRTRRTQNSTLRRRPNGGRVVGVACV